MRVSILTKLFNKKMETTIKNRRSLDRTMTQLSRHKQQATMLASQMEAQLQTIRNKFTPRIDSLSAKQETLRTNIIGYARVNREELFTPKQKRIELTDGYVGFRQGRPSLVLQEGYTWNDALIALQQESQAENYIRTKYEIDRAQLLSHHEDPTVKRLIQRIGLRVSCEEQFYAEAK